MVFEKDNYSFYGENEFFELAVFSSIGGRTDQQDSAGYEFTQNGGIVTVCDGMGGHDGGKLASSHAVSRVLELYLSKDADTKIYEFLLDSAERIDSEIAAITYPDGTKMQAGSTIVCAVIEDKHFHWLSVGDSRIYLSRGEEFVKITTDHNYLTRLDQYLSCGQITKEKYEAELHKSDALVSFLGVSGISMIDCNEMPFILNTNDKIILATDGLYKLISDDQIKSLTENFSNISDAVQALELKVRRIAAQKKIGRDNMTAVIIKIK